METGTELDMGENARIHPRYEVQAYVDVTGPDVLLYHQIQNMSLGGICIQTATIAEVGSLVDVVINFPDLGAELNIRGQVVWANREPPQDVGIRWIDIDDETKALLSKYIALVKTRELADSQPQ
jgi:uncharacterized protein (TIGR02266 family)